MESNNHTLSEEEYFNSLKIESEEDLLNEIEGFKSYDYITSSEINDIIQNVKFTDPKEIVNFYRSKPEGDILVNRGDTVNLEFTAVYADGTSGPYTDIVYSDLPPESVATFSGNSFTISEKCRASIFTSIAKPNIEDTTLYAFVQAKILNPVNLLILAL